LLYFNVASPDFNPIERVWDLVRKAICHRRPFPTTKEATRKAWCEEFKAIPIEKINSLISSVPTRLQQCFIDNGGNHFRG
jgi:transposase